MASFVIPCKVTAYGRRIRSSTSASSDFSHSGWQAAGGDAVFLRQQRGDAAFHFRSICLRRVVVLLDVAVDRPADEARLTISAVTETGSTRLLIGGPPSRPSSAS